MTDRSKILIASNRGPVAVVREPDGSLVERRGVGGLVTAVTGAVRGHEVTWVAAAITDADRERARGGAFSIQTSGGGTVRVRLADIPPPTYDAYYNDFSNKILWFLHHYLWSPTQLPQLGAGDDDAWTAYRDVNEIFARALADETDATSVALTQDYHLSLLPAALRAMRPDAKIAHFWHIPFCMPDQFRILPDAWGVALLEGMLAADVVGFHTERWAANFIASCRAVLGARTRGRTIEHGGRTTRTGIYPIGVSLDHLQEEARDERVARAAVEIDEIAADRVLLLRVDRTELSKNILRGLLAYERLLERRTDLHERVVHLALLTPSRRHVPEYERYMHACGEAATRINERYARPGWDPVLLEIEDDFHRTLAAYKRYDVLLVNPVYDGMNLVAREGPLLNERDGVLVLSRNAGAAAELSPAALIVNPFDTNDTARAIETAIDMSAADRRSLAARLRPLAKGTSPKRWLEAQLRDASRTRGS